MARKRPATRRPHRALTRTLTLGLAGLLVGATPALGAGGEAEGALAARAVQAVADSATPQLLPSQAPRATSTYGRQAVTGSGQFSDAVGDQDGGLAPDIQALTAFTSDDGRYTAAIRLNSNSLIEGDSVFTFVDTDGNTATGSPDFSGADLAVGILGQTGTDVFGALRWDGYDFVLADVPSLVAFTSGATDEVWSVAAAEVGIAPGARTTLQVTSIYEDYYGNDYFDWAPDLGLAPFAFTAGSLTPPPPAPPVSAPSPSPGPAPAPPLAPRTTTAPTGATRPAAVPRPVALRSFALSRAGRSSVKARIGWLRGSGRVTWDLRLSAKVGPRTVAKVVRGSGRPGLRNLTRTVALPPSWRGRIVSARLVLRDDAKRIVRTQAVVL